MQGVVVLASILSSTSTTQVLTYPRSGPSVALVVNAPSGRSGLLRPDDVRARIASLLFEHTDLEMVAVDPSVVGTCSGKLACMVLAVRRDYDRLALENADGTMRPFEEHLEWLKARKIVPSSHLLVLTHFTQEEMTERLSLLLLDTTRALRVLHDERGDEASIESSLVARSVVLEQTFRVEGRGQADRALTSMIDELRSHFAATGHWDPFGEIDLRSDVGGASISIGGVSVGRARGGSVRVVGVPPGEQTIVVAHPDREPFEATVDVPQGRSVVVEVTLAEPLDTTSAHLRSAVLWSGVVIAALGAAITIVGVVPSATTNACVHSAATPCEVGDTWKRFGSGSDRADASGNGSGPPILPLGLGLVSLGAAWSLGTYLFGAEDDLPWIQLLAGAALFGATFGTMLALDGPSPF